MIGRFKPLLFAGCAVLLFVLVIGLVLNGVSGTQSVGDWVASHPTETETPLLINLNTATEKELLQLPEMTHAMAKAILSYRDSFVRFRYVEELLAVHGVSERRLDLWRPYITL